ncbi:iron sulfur cluster assembly protein [Aspergillus indologenus CBS 114.80]|uniref:Iron-sulfur cluster assembly protein n=1 Tax=Aspergillus indologenus CBS 114.80 TaxID=1450541 RepID=A0A2V5I2L8_9EURO|nr:iron sulfur cluster assembly protein [Aspergillus indologenus CBS 114.80]
MFRRLVTVAPRAAGVLSPRIIAPAVAGVQQQTQTSSLRASTPSPLQPQRRGYHEKVLDHYSNPRNVGSMAKSVDVGTGLVGAPACGDVMKLQIRVDKDTNVISDVKFKTFGCGSAIASSSYLTELVRGMTLDEAAKIRNTDIAKELCLPPVKLHCSMLAEDAIKSAISDYYTKNPKAVKTNLAGTGASIPDLHAQPEKAAPVA